jgi:hypothetical protein
MLNRTMDTSFIVLVTMVMEEVDAQIQPIGLSYVEKIIQRI